MQRAQREAKFQEDKSTANINLKNAVIYSNVKMVISPEKVQKQIQDKTGTGVGVVGTGTVNHVAGAIASMTLNQVVDISCLYLERENQALIHNYGPELYDCSRDMESVGVFPDLLKRHKIESQTRTKMIDWMLEVLYAYNSDAQTIFLAVHILDSYIFKTRNMLTNADVHLAGIVAMYMASKMEDIIPLRMSLVKPKIGHNKFSEKEIKKKERQILETIDFEVIATSTYDFIKTFLFDFCHNNREYIEELKMHHHLESFENVSIYLAKMMFHHEDFCNYK